MTAWPRLRLQLTELMDAQPGAVIGCPNPHTDSGEPPFSIHLAAWADAEAERMHQEFGPDIVLEVGALTYPMSASAQQPLRREPDTEVLDPDEVGVELDGDATVASGHDVNHGVFVENRTRDTFIVVTNGMVTAHVVDPATGEVIGGSVNPQRLSRRDVHIRGGEVVRIPLLIGSASFVPSLGYAVPAGRWGLVIPMMLEDADGTTSPRKTPILPLTVHD